MGSLLCDSELQRVRRGLNVYYVHREHTVEEMAALLRAQGEELKSSNKSRVVRVGEWVLKSSSTPQPLRLIKHTLMRERYRRSWLAAHHLMRHGVLVPRPVAYVESNVLGLIGGHTVITEYLRGQRNVEEYMRAMIDRGAGSDTIAFFLDRLGKSINHFVESGAYHGDLSGKNIFTEDGSSFVFLDLDAVELGMEYTDELRLKNHVQLYDSFCDLLSDKMLTPFISRLLSDKQDLRIWMPKVRKGQKERREHQVEIWSRQGRA